MPWTQARCSQDPLALGQRVHKGQQTQTALFFPKLFITP